MEMAKGYGFMYGCRNCPRHFLIEQEKTVHEAKCNE
jgi:hypothetical protein